MRPSGGPGKPLRLYQVRSRLRLRVVIEVGASADRPGAVVVPGDEPVRRPIHTDADDAAGVGRERVLVRAVGCEVRRISGRAVSEACVKQVREPERPLGNPWYVGKRIVNRVEPGPNVQVSE